MTRRYTAAEIGRALERSDRYEAQLVEAINAWPQFDTANEEVSGADLVEWFAGWRSAAIRIVRDV